MGENRRRLLQQTQLRQAVEDRRRSGSNALYAFEQERVLLAFIRAGDRNGARRILNDMLAAIFMSSPKLVVLRARAIELMSCLTRAAIEDNPMLEPLIQRNHGCTERLIAAKSFEELSRVLMSALDSFIDGVHLHGVNRLEDRIRKVLDFIDANYTEHITLGDVARHVGLSASRMAHLIKESTGKTLIQIVQEVRVGKARRLLERTSMSCAEVGYAVGFSDQSYFTKQFRLQTGATPSAYRRIT